MQKVTASYRTVSISTKSPPSYFVTLELSHVVMNNQMINVVGSHMVSAHEVLVSPYMKLAIKNKAN